MAYGKLKLIDNLDPLMGSSFSYWFVKVRSGPAEWQEEHWLVTMSESDRFEERGGHVTRPRPPARVQLGKLEPWNPARDLGYGCETVDVRRPTGEVLRWVLTPRDLETLRYRAERNVEDIVKNRESWLADLLD